MNTVICWTICIRISSIERSGKTDLSLQDFHKFSKAYPDKCKIADAGKVFMQKIRDGTQQHPEAQFNWENDSLGMYLDFSAACLVDVQDESSGAFQAPKLRFDFAQRPDLVSYLVMAF